MKPVNCCFIGWLVVMSGPCQEDSANSVKRPWRR